MSKTLAIIYARVSSSGSLEYRQNTDRQVQDLKEYATYKGFELMEVFNEHISGAKKNTERPVLSEAIEKCTSNPQPIGFRGNLLVKRPKFFYCTYSLGITETS